MRGQVWGAVALTLGLGACSGIQVNTDYNPEIDFTAYRTFDWAEGSGGGADGVVTELVDQRFRRSVEAELASRGMERATSSQPDVFIGYQVTLDDRVDYQDGEHILRRRMGIPWRLRRCGRHPDDCA